MPATGSSTSSSLTSVATVLGRRRPPGARPRSRRDGGRGSDARGGRGRRSRRRRRRRGCGRRGCRGVAVVRRRGCRGRRAGCGRRADSGRRVVAVVRAATAIVGPVSPVGPVAALDPVVARSAVVRAVRARTTVAAGPPVLPARLAPAAVAGALRSGLGSDVDGRRGHRCTVLALIGAVGPLAARTALARASGDGTRRRSRRRRG